MGVRKGVHFHPGPLDRGLPPPPTIETNQFGAAVSYIDSTLMPGESVIYRAKVHRIVYLKPILWSAVAAILALPAFGMPNANDEATGVRVVFYIFLAIAALTWLKAMAIHLGSEY